MEGPPRYPLEIFPKEIWEMIILKVKDSEDLRNLMQASKQLNDMFMKIHHLWLLDKVLPLLMTVPTGRLGPYLGGKDVKNLRLVDKRWNGAVDAFLENQPNLRPYNKDDDKLNSEKHKTWSDRFPDALRDLATLGRVVLTNQRGQLSRSGETFEALEKFGRSDRNPFPARSIVRFRLPSEPANIWGELDQDVSQKISNHVWFLTLEIAPCNSSKCEPKLAWEWIIHSLTSFPNLKGLHLERVDRQQDVTDYMSDFLAKKFLQSGKNQLPPLPSLESLKIIDFEMYPELFSQQLTSKYSLQLRRLETSAWVWETREKWMFPNLTELCLQDIGTGEMVTEILTSLEAPQLAKLCLLPFRIRSYRGVGTNLDMEKHIFPWITLFPSLLLLDISCRELKISESGALSPPKDSKPSLKYLKIHNSRDVNYNFLRCLPSLQRLQIIADEKPIIWDCSANPEIKIKLEIETSSIYQSNVWDLCPKLRRLSMFYYTWNYHEEFDRATYEKLKNAPVPELPDHVELRGDIREFLYPTSDSEEDWESEEEEEDWESEREDEDDFETDEDDIPAGPPRYPLEIFPKKIWEMIILKVKDSEDLRNLMKASKQLNDMFMKIHHLWLLDKVLPILTTTSTYKEKRYLGGKDVMKLRLVDKRWCGAVDAFLENQPNLRPYNKDDEKVNSERHIWSGRSYRHESWDSTTIGEVTLYNDEDQLSRSTFKALKSFGKSERNPFPSRAITRLREPSELVPKIWGELDQDISQKIGMHVWFLKMEMNWEYEDDNDVNKYGVTSVWEWIVHSLTSLPNLKGLHLEMHPRSCSVDYMSGCEAKEYLQSLEIQLPSLPSLESLTIDRLKLYPVFFCEQLLSTYSLQLRRLQISTEALPWETRIEWALPNLTELCLEDIDTIEDIRDILLSLDAPQLAKIRLLAQYNSGIKLEMDDDIFFWMALFPSLLYLDISCNQFSINEKGTLQNVNETFKYLKIYNSHGVNYNFLRCLPYLQRLQISVDEKPIVWDCSAYPKIKIKLEIETNSLYQSNVWDLCPELRSVSIYHDTSTSYTEFDRATYEKLKNTPVPERVKSDSEEEEIPRAINSMGVPSDSDDSEYEENEELPGSLQESESESD